MYEFGREKCIQKLRIPVIQLKGCEPSTFYSSQSRLKNSRFNGESYRQFKTKTNVYTGGHGFTYFMKY